MKYTIRTEYPLSGDAVVIKYDNSDNIAEINGEEYDAVRLAPYFQKGKSLNDLKERIILRGKDENGVNAVCFSDDYDKGGCGITMSENSDLGRISEIKINIKLKGIEKE